MLNYKLGATFFTPYVEFHLVCVDDIAHLRNIGVEMTNVIYEPDEKSERGVVWSILPREDINVEEWLFPILQREFGHAMEEVEGVRKRGYDKTKALDFCMWVRLINTEFIPIFFDKFEDQNFTIEGRQPTAGEMTHFVMFNDLKPLIEKFLDFYVNAVAAVGKAMGYDK